MFGVTVRMEATMGPWEEGGGGGWYMFTNMDEPKKDMCGYKRVNGFAAWSVMIGYWLSTDISEVFITFHTGHAL